MKDDIVSCTKCHHRQYYELKNPHQENPRATCEVCGHRYSVGKYFKKGKKGKKSNFVPPQTKITPQRERVNSSPSPKFINKLENPVKAVQDLIVDELWKTRDVRWAKLFVDILRDTKKLDYDTIKEEEWQHQAQNMELSDLVELVAKKGSITRSTSRRLDELEDTSPYENL